MKRRRYVENFQVIPANQKLDENYFDQNNFYPEDTSDASGVPFYESGDASPIGEGLGEYDTAGGGSWSQKEIVKASGDSFVNEMGDSGFEEFSEARGDFLKSLKKTYSRRSDKNKPKTFGDKLKRAGGLIPIVALAKAGMDSAGNKKRKRRKGKRRRPQMSQRPSNMRRRPSKMRRRPINTSPPGMTTVDLASKQLDNEIRKFASEPTANFTGKYGNGLGEYSTGGGGSHNEPTSSANGYGNGLGEYMTGGGGSHDLPVHEETSNANGYGNGLGEYMTGGGGSHNEPTSNMDGKGNGLTTGAKIGIGIGALGLIGAIAFMIIKSKKK